MPGAYLCSYSYIISGEQHAHRQGEEEPLPMAYTKAPYIAEAQAAVFLLLRIAYIVVFHLGLVFHVHDVEDKQAHSQCK